MPENLLPVPVPVKARSPMAAPPVPVRPVIVPVCDVVPVPENVTSIDTVPVETERVSVPLLLSDTTATVLPV